MPPLETDSRSPSRRAQDEAIAAKPHLSSVEFAPDTLAVPVETHLDQNQRKVKNMSNTSLHDGKTFYNDAGNLPKHWEAVAISLMEYARHISKSEPHWKTEQWVFRPKNFVTFRIQHKRKTGLTLYLRGTADEYPTLHNSKTVVDSIPAYSKIILDDFSQVLEAFFAVNRAYELYERGSSRGKKKLVIKEDFS